MSQDTEIEGAEYSQNEEVKIEDMSIQALRKFAALYRITLPKTATKDDILEIINNKRNAQDLAKVVSDEDRNRGPLPGWARINVHADPTPGAANNPVYVNANGYVVTVPRGVDVDVPIKVVGVLNDAVEQRLVENFQEPMTSPNRWEYKKMLSYPFNVIAQTPGPDPRPGFEKGKKATMGPRLKFRELFGRWPQNNAELLDAQKEGFIKLQLTHD